MDIHTSVYSKNQLPYNVLDDLQVGVSVEHNPYDLSMDQLFQMAARQNKKRAYLFVSPVLGKHIPVSPYRSLLTGALLAARLTEVVYDEPFPHRDELIRAFQQEHEEQVIYKQVQESRFSLPERSLFIGFAETATALGQSVFEHFTNARYVHTTREDLVGIAPTLNFQEEHSHATDQRCYGEEEFTHDGPVVLVDDEITTGKTALNIIRTMQETYPRSTYVVLSILDWRSEEHQQRFRSVEEEQGITIHEVSLLKGTMESQGEVLLSNEPASESIDGETSVQEITAQPFKAFHSDRYVLSTNGVGEVSERPYLSNTGRFGLSESDQLALEEAAASFGLYLRNVRKGSKTLCLGTGEFMYIPMKLASYMGEGVQYQSTTRSPIHLADKKGYAVQAKLTYKSPEDRSVQHFLYNMHPNQYDEVFVFLERSRSEEEMKSFLEALTSTGVETIHLVTFS
ncbi:phosphoribosyltransferase family protein [Pontibacillus halophilus]|uniref:phosphoribosyltransferase family protein n=1 Tax=Pontibacillus halophilus TaxID=516704 RepID=UPI0003FF0810|nr:phosphoribosyltransferase family protein [Pontibacillus halophilus]